MARLTKCISKVLGLGLQRQRQPRLSVLIPNLGPQSPRTYISQNQESAVSSNLLNIVRSEIHYELDRLPLNQPGAEYNSYTINGRPGEKWVTLKRQFGRNEHIKIEATMFDGTSYDSKFRDSDALRSHISVVVTIRKQGVSDDLEFWCSAWSNSLEIDKLGTRKLDHSQAKSYFSPYFKELDDKLVDALYGYLEERGIDDDIAVFLHYYMKNKEKIEYIRWMENIKCFVENS